MSTVHSCLEVLFEKAINLLDCLATASLFNYKSPGTLRFGPSDLDTKRF